MTQKRQMIALLLSGALLGAAAPARAVVNEYQTLELVRTYASEEEFQAANEKMLREKHPIVDDETFIKFIDPETGNVVKQIKKEQTYDELMASLAKPELQQIDPNNPQSLIKTFYEYEIPSSSGSRSYLHILEYQIRLSERDEIDNEQTVKASTLYNRLGEKVVDLPFDVNKVVVATDENTFIAYQDDLLNPGDFLYFYQTDGVLLKKVAFPHLLVNFTYSANGKFVALHYEMGQLFHIFTSTGDLVFEANFHTYAGINANLYGVFISDDGNFFLLSTSDKAILIDRNGNKQWEVDVPQTPIDSAYFQQNGLLYILSLLPDIEYELSEYPIGSLKLMVIRSETGEVIEEISDVTYYTIYNGMLYVQKRGGTYDEYMLK